MNPPRLSHGPLGLAIIFLLLATLGCGGGHRPLTRELLDAGVDFDALPSGLAEFDVYADSPPSKAFAASLGPDGAVHAWAKA